MSAKELEKWHKVAKKALEGLDLSRYAALGRDFLNSLEAAKCVR